jgi:5'-nucleotidase / UDP-sugar diphosphatase
VATNDFLVAGGDGYRAFSEALKGAGDYSGTGGALKSNKLTYCDPGKWLRDLVIAYIKSEKEISPPVTDRIKEIN